MVDEDSKKKAALAFVEGLDNLCRKVDKDYQELIKFNGSLEDTLKKAEDYTFNHEIHWKKLEDDLFIPYELADRIDICRARQKFLLSDSGRGLTSIKIALKIIKNNTCNKCKKQLAKDNCHVYLPKSQSVRKWTVEQAQKFDGENFPILFCTENCFKQSIYYPQPKPKSKQPKKTKQNTNHQLQNQQQTTQSAQEDYTYCPQCPKKIKDSDKYWYHTIKNDNRKFCSKKCLINYYGEYCLTCKPYQKYLDIYRLDENDSFGYCWDCYQEQIRKLEELEKERAATEKRIEEQKKEQETWEKAQVKHNHLEHSPQSRERERERERESITETIKQYLQQNNIHSITLQPNGELLIKYQNQQTKTMNANTQELKQIQAYLQSQGKQSINQSELRSEQSPRKNYLPWILGGIAGLGLIGVVVYFLRRKGEK